jgi:hypothetical protein
MAIPRESRTVCSAFARAYARKAGVITPALWRKGPRTREYATPRTFRSRCHRTPSLASTLVPPRTELGSTRGIARYTASRSGFSRGSSL